MPPSKARRRPPIHMIDIEADRLTALALAAEEHNPHVCRLLLDEIGRARIHGAGRIGTDVVTMHTKVQFVDAATGKEYDYELVYPGEADIAAGRISIMTLVGAGLIGLREGQSIHWPDRDGRERELTIVSVRQAAPSC